MPEKRADMFESIFGSNYISHTYCKCICGCTANFYGTPDEVNKAGKEFYDIHKPCRETVKETT